MRALKDLKLHKKTYEKVCSWLQEWLTLFEEQAEHKEAWVYRADFENNNFYYHTNCKDILSKDPECKAVENNMKIRSRKRKIMMQLFLKTLLGIDLKLIKITCNHCHYVGCWINALKDGTGSWVYCPKCAKTDIHVFPEGYENCIQLIQAHLEKLSNEEQYRAQSPPTALKTQKMKVDPRYREQCQEIKDYKYKRGSSHVR